MTAAGDLIRYLEGLKVGQGRLAGQPFTVLPWQARFLRGAHRAGVFEAALTMARGGGKSTFTAGVALAALEGPLAAPGAEVVIVAASLAQARIIFRHVVRFIGEDVVRNRDQFRTWDSPARAAIHSKRTGVLLELKGCTPGTLHGLAPSLIIADELAQWPPNRIDAALAALDTSLGKIPGGRFWKIGTRPASPSHPFALALKEADYRQVHAARPSDPPFWKRTWARACPSLPYFPDLEAKIRAEAKKAKRDPAALASFKALRLNLGTSDIIEAALIEAEEWARAEGVADPVGPCYWGVDLGTTAASSAVAGFWRRSGRLEVVAAFPSLPSLAERGLRDGVGRLYEDQYARGELLTVGGNAVDVSVLIREALRRFGRPVAVAADRWREGELRDALAGAGVTRTALALRGMGYKDGGEDVRQFRRGIAEGKVVPVVSLVLRAAMAEARTVSDPAGNAKLAKGTQGQRRDRARDDAAAAAILAVAEGLRRGARPARRGRRVAVAG